MLEKMFASLPDWVQSKVVIRIIYTAGSFLTARLISFLTGDYLNNLAGQVVAASGHIGIVLQFKVVSVDQRALETAITGVLMVAAEFLINHFHENTIKPAILAAAAQPEPPKAAS